MSDRLINAEKLFNSRPEWLNEDMTDKEKSLYNKGWNACNSEWCDMVQKQPTAYDLDKVCEQLEKYSDIVKIEIDSGIYDRNPIIFTDVAVNIVKGGGTSEKA